MTSRRQTSFGLLHFALLLATLASYAQEEGALQRLQRAQADVTEELSQVERDIQRDRERLRRLEVDQRTVAVTAVALEDARLELATLRSRESGLVTRLKARRRAVLQLNEAIAALESQIQQSPADETLEVGSWRQDLASLVERRGVLVELIEKVERLHKRYQVRTALVGQRLTLLQARFELPDLNAARQSLGQAGRELQQQVDVLLSEASEARREAAALGHEPRDEARRRLLELRAMAAEERAEFDQLSIARLQVDRVLQSLSAFSGTRSAPVRALKTALHNIDEMMAELRRQQAVVEQKRAQFLDRRQIVEQQGAIATGTDSTVQVRLGLIDELVVAADQQLAAIAVLEARVQSTREAYGSAVAASAGKELLIRGELPPDVESWKQLGGSLATLPLRIALAFRDALYNFGLAFVRSDVGTQASGFGLLLALLLVGWQIRRRVPVQFAAPSGAPDGTVTPTWAPLVMLRRSLASLLAPTFVLGVGLILDVRRADLVLLLAPLLIWPAVRFALDFINNLLDEFTPNLDQGKTRVLLLETRWVVVLAALLAALLATAHIVALSPAVISALDRLSMVFLLLISVPLLHMRSLLLTGIRTDVASRWLRGTTILVPLLVVLCALIGLWGYTNLAWDIAERLGWLLLVGVGVLFVRDVLRAMLKAAGSWFEKRDADSAPSWKQYILGPSYRVVLLLVALGAAQLLFYLYDWNAQTPVIGTLPSILDATLFSVGTTAVKLKTLGLAIVALFVAFWGASWSKEISYRWLYTGVHDQGIRSSLATFTQYLFVVLGLVVAMKIIGLDLTALTVFAGALGVGIGFGMQTIVVNFISGILLLVERPLATSDMVNVDKYEGEVTRIGIRSLTIKTFDNQEVIIPNSAVITQPFINWTRSDDIIRTVLMVGISYDDDPKQAVALIKEQVVAHPAVLENPGTKVLLWDYADSALMIRVQFHTRVRGEIGRADVRSQVLFAIWDAFKSAGITIPYPQRDVHMHSVVPSATDS